LLLLLLLLLLLSSSSSSSSFLVLSDVVIGLMTQSVSTRAYRQFVQHVLWCHRRQIPVLVVVFTKKRLERHLQRNILRTFFFDYHRHLQVAVSGEEDDSSLRAVTASNDIALRTQVAGFDSEIYICIITESHVFTA